ncbi:hypothetical protein LTR85_009964 [Meristemomyces frigidus]|nr:hypothetical protein LTR85_009964 [Meristemomyces frigidus]
MGVLSGTEAAQALKHIVKAIYLYDDVGNKRRTQILKGYALGVLDLAAFNRAYIEEADERTKQRLGLLGVPSIKVKQEDGQAERKVRPEQVAGDLVMEAVREIERVDEQKADALRRVVYEEQNERNNPDPSTALPHLIRASYYYDAAGCQSRGQILKAYAYAVFGLPAYDEVDNGDPKDTVTQALVVKYPDPEAKKVPKQVRDQARTLAEAEVWTAHLVISRADEQRYPAFDRLLKQEMGMKYDGIGGAI